MKTSIANMKKSVFFTYAVMVAVMLSLVTGEKCGYVRGPLAATNDTVVIKLDCNYSTSLSHYIPLQLPHNVTHLAVQLVRCQTVPIGLFNNVSKNLTSVTVASEDAVQLLEGTFDGLGHVRELRLLGFSSLINMSVSLFKPLRNIETLTLDGFGRSNIKLPHLGSAVQKLTRTPITRIVFNDIRGHTSTKLLEDRTMRANEFEITNASVKELIISNTPMHYEGSIRRAFPYLTCFYGCKGIVETAKSLPVAWDLFMLSDTLNEFIYHKYSNPFQNLPMPDITAKEIYALMFGALKYYPDLLTFALNRSIAKGCAVGITLRLGANISRIVLFKMNIMIEKLNKPSCWDQDNKLKHFDLTGCPLPKHFVGFRGLGRLKYLSLANTRIKSLSNDFLHHFPALEILKLGQLDIGKFLKSIDSNFFVYSPALKEIHLDNCQLTDIFPDLISALINFQHSAITKTPTNDVEFGFRNSTNLKLVNFSRNNIKTVSQNSIDKLNELAREIPKGSGLFVDLSYNDLHCLCNSTHFVKWLQQTNSKIMFENFDSYTCLYPNGSTVLVSQLIFSGLQKQCSVTQTFVNRSNCPCNEKERTRLEQVWMSLDGFFCINDDGDLVAMTNRPLPSCFNPYMRASFIAPVVIGGILGITVLITVGLLIYHRNNRRAKQVRECLEMNPVRFARAALQYMMMHNREEQAEFGYQMFVFAQTQDDYRNSIHTQFLAALHERRSIITRENIVPGAVELDAILESIDNCQWIVPVLTANFLSDPVCKDFVNRVQFSRPHALIPVVWEQLVDVTDVSICELLRTGDPLYWPGDMAAAVKKHNFWAAILERTLPLH